VNKAKKGAEWIDWNLIPVPMYVGLCTNEAQFHRELRRMKVPQNHWPDFVSKGAKARVHRLDKVDDATQACSIVCISDDIECPVQIIGLLIHEAVHVWQNICEAIFEDNPSGEFEAYGIQSIALGLIEAYADSTATGKDACKTAVQPDHNNKEGIAHD
jgi:hypothetical protein